MNNTCLTAWEELYRITALREEQRRAQEHLIRYRLCVSRFASPEYYVEILLENQRAAAALGSNYEKANDLFEILVRGLVTPCTLGDIIQDIKNA